MNMHSSRGHDGIRDTEGKLMATPQRLVINLLYIMHVNVTVLSHQEYRYWTTCSKSLIVDNRVTSYTGKAGVRNCFCAN